MHIVALYVSIILISRYLSLWKIGLSLFLFSISLKLHAVTVLIILRYILRILFGCQGYIFPSIFNRYLLVSYIRLCSTILTHIFKGKDTCYVKTITNFLHFSITRLHTKCMAGYSSPRYDIRRDRLALGT